MKNFFKELKDKWDGYLKRLAETNRKLYGNSRLDCCGLNKENKVTRDKIS